MPSQIERVQRRYGGRIAIVAINIQESQDKVAAWLGSHPLSSTVLLDSTGAVTATYEVTATPTVFVLSREGRLVGKALGNKPWDSPAGHALLDRLAGS